MSLQLRSLTRRFGRHLALDAVSLCVRPGDTYGLIGHNGAGKTTALRIALGLMLADEGSVIVDGFDAARDSNEARARIGGLIESPGFHPSWDGHNNLLLLARLQGMSPGRARDEVTRTLELVGLPGLAGKPVRAYSHGMRQRLGIGQALLGSPRYLLLDEPTDGLDPEGIAEMRSLIARLTSEEGRAVLISSHQLHELTGLCNRVGVMKQGRLLVERDTEELLADGGRYELRSGDDTAATADLRQQAIDVTAGRRGGLTLELGERDPAEVARALVERGHRIVAFAPVEHTLEEVYLGLRGDQGEPAAGPPAEVLALDPPGERLAPPWPVLRVLRHEAMRWARSPGTWLLLSLPAILAVLNVVSRWLDAEGFAAEVERGELASTTAVTAFEGMAIALKSGLPALVLVLLGITSQSIAGELGRGTLRNVVLRPLTRGQLVLGKALGGLACAVVGYAGVLLCGGLASILAFDFEDVGDLLPNGELIVLVAADELWVPLAAAAAAPLLPLAAYVGLGFAVGAALRGPVVALALALGLWIVLDLGRGFARAIDRLADLAYPFEACLPSFYLPSPFSDTSYVEFYSQLSQGVSNVMPRHTAVDLIVPACWALAGFALAAMIVRRRFVP